MQSDNAFLTEKNNSETKVTRIKFINGTMHKDINEPITNEEIEYNIKLYLKIIDVRDRIQTRAANITKNMIDLIKDQIGKFDAVE